MTTADRAKVGNTAAMKFFTIAEIARQLAVTPRTVHRWIEDGQLAVHRFGRAVRISENDWKMFLAVHRDVN